MVPFFRCKQEQSQPVGAARKRLWCYTRRVHSPRETCTSPKGVLPQPLKKKIWQHYNTNTQDTLGPTRGWQPRHAPAAPQQLSTAQTPTAGAALMSQTHTCGTGCVNRRTSPTRGQGLHPTHASTHVQFARCGRQVRAHQPLTLQSFFLLSVGNCAGRDLDPKNTARRETALRQGCQAHKTCQHIAGMCLAPLLSRASTAAPPADRRRRLSQDSAQEQLKLGADVPRTHSAQAPPTATGNTSTPSARLQLSSTTCAGKHCRTAPCCSSTAHGCPQCCCARLLLLLHTHSHTHTHSSQQQGACCWYCCTNQAVRVGAA